MTLLKSWNIFSPFQKKQSKKIATLKELDVDSTGMLGLVTFLVNDIGMEVDIDRLRNAKTIQDIITLTNGKVQ
jgi:acyl carrier protein